MIYSNKQNKTSSVHSIEMDKNSNLTSLFSILKKEKWIISFLLEENENSIIESNSIINSPITHSSLKACAFNKEMPSRI